MPQFAAHGDNMKRITQADVQQSARSVYHATQAMRAAVDALRANRTHATLGAFRVANAAHSVAYAAHAVVMTAHSDAQARQANDKYYAKLAKLRTNAALHKISI